MAPHPVVSPAFGQADLSNCEREQIQFAGSIQPHGVLLVLRESDQTIVQASANASAFLNLDKSVLNQPISKIEGNLWERIGPHLSEPLDSIPIAVRCDIGTPTAKYDGLLHRPPQGGLIIELERAGSAVDLTEHVEHALLRIMESASLRSLCDETARLLNKLTGYDRVMVYRFDAEGHGEVYSEHRKSELESYLGNRYPASDIPQIARRLYERNRVRVLVDVACQSVPLEPLHSPITGQDLDMSLCFLRSMSPIHIQYLKNMGVGATLVVSLLVNGKLWGLIACHHYAPRFVNYEIRAICELLAEIIATRIAALESFVQAQAELSVRRLEQRMIEAISRDGDWRTALFDSSQTLLQPLNAAGAALLFEGQVLTAGEVPGTQQLRQIGAWLDRQATQGVIATASLGLDEPEFASLTSVASGVLAAPVSNTAGEYLIWFRPERVRTVTWGGNPFKPVEIGNNPSDLSPRRSFSQWHQLVEGTSDPWTSADLTAARLIGESVADVVHQFRSVQLLIAQDQLDHISRQVQNANQPVVITDPEGRILLSNQAFECLLRADHPSLQWLGDLVNVFSDPSDVHNNLRGLLEQRRPWRGEVTLGTLQSSKKSLLIRADPVYSAPGRVLGFVVLFTDLSEQKAAEAARRRFQEGILERHQFLTLNLDSKADLVYRNLLSRVVDNAQIAALEITDGVDLARMPEMLESLQISVTRTAELLDHLVWHAMKFEDKNT